MNVYIWVMFWQFMAPAVECGPAGPNKMFWIIAELKYIG